MSRRKGVLFFSLFFLVQLFWRQEHIPSKFVGHDADSRSLCGAQLPVFAPTAVFVVENLNGHEQGIARPPSNSARYSVREIMRVAGGCETSKSRCSKEGHSHQWVEIWSRENALLLGLGLWRERGRAKSRGPAQWHKEQRRRWAAWHRQPECAAFDRPRASSQGNQNKLLGWPSSYTPASYLAGR